MDHWPPIRFLYEGIPGLGDVELSYHARQRLEADGVTHATVEDTLCSGRTTPDGHTTVLKEKHGVRLVIDTQPKPYRGRALVMTGYKVG